MRMGPLRMWDLVGIDLFGRERERWAQGWRWVHFLLEMTEDVNPLNSEFGRLWEKYPENAISIQ